MTDYHKCTPVGVEFLQQTKNVWLARETVRATPEQIFDVFEDPNAWTMWALPIRQVIWTSPKPYGVGTTRSVHMLGGLVGYERFVEWERGQRMAFTFLGSSSKATEKFLEDYRVTDLGDGSCRVDWYMAMEARGLSRHFLFLVRPLMGLAVRRVFRKFRRYTEAYAACPPAASTV